MSPAGVAVSLLRVLTKATLPDTEAGLRRSANLYFALTALVCASSTAVYAWAVPRLMQAHRQAALDAALHAGSDDEELAAGPAWKLLAQHPEAPAADVELSAVGAHPHTNGGAVDWQQGEQQREQRQRQQQELGAHEQQAFARQALLPAQQGPLGSSSSPGWLQPGPARHGAPPRSWAADGGLAGPASGLEVFQLIWRLAVSNMLIYV